MHLRRPFLDQIASGAKTIEIRVAYPHLADLAPGQRIRFHCDDDQVLVDVTRVAVYPGFEELLDAEPVEAINPGATRAEQLAVLRDIYPARKEQLGALAIEIQRATATSQSGEDS
jgi:ASC-1-like (ASCH) protein